MRHRARGLVGDVGRRLGLRDGELAAGDPHRGDQLLGRPVDEGDQALRGRDHPGAAAVLGERLERVALPVTTAAASGAATSTATAARRQSRAAGRLMVRTPRQVRSGPRRRPRSGRSPDGERGQRAEVDGEGDGQLVDALLRTGGEHAVPVLGPAGDAVERQADVQRPRVGVGERGLEPRLAGRATGADRVGGPHGCRVDPDVDGHALVPEHEGDRPADQAVGRRRADDGDLDRDGVGGVGVVQTVDFSVRPAGTSTVGVVVDSQAGSSSVTGASTKHSAVVTGTVAVPSRRRSTKRRSASAGTHRSA